MENRRGQERRRTLKSGKIIFNHRASVVDCLVRNLSTGGACLQLANVVGVPQTFDLVIDGVQRPCIVKWTNANRLGVSFCE